MENEQQDTQPWTRRVNPSYQPQSSGIKLAQAEKGFKRKSLENRVYPFLIVGVIGLGLYLSCNDEPKGKPLEGFSQEAYNQSLMPKRY